MEMLEEEVGLAFKGMGRDAKCLMLPGTDPKREISAQSPQMETLFKCLRLTSREAIRRGG